MAFFQQLAISPSNRIVTMFIFFFFFFQCASLETLVLERISPTASMEVSLLKDQARHASFMGVVDIPVVGSWGIANIGIYFTRVKIGNPPKEFHLMIDTGSDITWVNCISCTSCPRSSLITELSFFDPSSSSSAARVSCPSSNCTYSLSYEDGSGTSGYFVSDVFSFDTRMADSTTAISSASVIFGCSTYQSGDLTETQKALDGILGLGHQQMSVISQLSSSGKTPAAFSHCLRGDGGGVLVLGQAIAPGIIYSPLDPSRPNYNLYLLGISISGQSVPIAPDVFARSGGTIVDSGTTLAYLTTGAYDPFVAALIAAVPPSVGSFPKEEGPCFLVSSSVSSIRDVFPLVTLNFAGGASMVLKPEDYLVPRLEPVDGTWCIGFQKSQGTTVLGDLVLKDKIIVYDLAGQRLGWANYDCSSSVNVSLDSPGKHISRSSRDAPLYPIATVTSLGDIIKFSSSIPIESQRPTTMPGIPLDEANLIIEALNLYRRKTGCDKFFWIHLDKKLTTGAGLGGESRNDLEPPAFDVLDPLSDKVKTTRSCSWSLPSMMLFSCQEVEALSLESSRSPDPPTVYLRR